MPLLLADVVDNVPGLAERLIPPERLLCLAMASRSFRLAVGDMLDSGCVRELFLRLKPGVSARDAKRIKLWRFKTCQIHLRVPVSSMMEVRTPRPLDRRRSPHACTHAQRSGAL